MFRSMALGVAVLALALVLMPPGGAGCDAWRQDPSTLRNPPRHPGQVPEVGSDAPRAREATPDAAPPADASVDG